MESTFSESVQYFVAQEVTYKLIWTPSQPCLFVWFICVGSESQPTLCGLDWFIDNIDHRHAKLGVRIPKREP